MTTSRSASDGGISDRLSSDRAIENLIATYAHVVDAGDFAGVGALLANATFSGASGTVHGAAAIATTLRDRLIVYEDGTPRTKHLTTNVAIEIDEPAGTARSRSYLTVPQPCPIWPFSRSSAVATTIGSSALTGDGALRSGVLSAI